MKAAIYIHIPFCIKKCAYCDFYSTEFDEILVSRFVAGCLKEIERYEVHPVFSESEIETLYFGGGTPSLLTPDQLSKIISKIDRRFKLKNNFELTVEANPETISFEYLKEIKNIGVNRLSIGVQSFSDEELQILGRIHNAEQARKCIDWAYQAGFTNLSIDLIFAIPGQSKKGWQSNLEQAVHLQPQHLSVYCLTVESGTPLEKMIEKGRIKKSGEKVEREFYLGAIDYLKEHNYFQYEISNFAQSGYKSQHNSLYWNLTPYLGIGPSAHSYCLNHRHWNVRSVKQYIAMLQNDELPIADHEELTLQQREFEFIMLKLRTVEGIPLIQFQQEFGLSFIEKYQKVIDKLKFSSSAELFKIENDSFYLTKYGFVLYDEICSHFVDY